MATPKLPGLGIIRKHLDLISDSEVFESRLQELHETGIFTNLLKAPKLDTEKILEAIGYDLPENIVFGNRLQAEVNIREGFERFIDLTNDYTDALLTTGPQKMEYWFFSLRKAMPMMKLEAELEAKGKRFPTPWEMLGGLLTDSSEHRPVVNMPLSTVKQSGGRWTLLAWARGGSHDITRLGNFTVGQGHHLAVNL